MVAVRAVYICAEDTSWMYYKFMSKVKMSESKGQNASSPHGDCCEREINKGVWGCIIEVRVVLQ